MNQVIYMSLSIHKFMRSFHSLCTRSNVTCASMSHALNRNVWGAKHCVPDVQVCSSLDTGCIPPSEEISKFYKQALALHHSLTDRGNNHCIANILYCCLHLDNCRSTQTYQDIIPHRCHRRNFNTTGATRANKLS